MPNTSANSIYYEANINSPTFNLVLTTPPANKPGYIFKGWYTTSAGLDDSKFTFTTMPASNLVLYSRWDKPQYTATFKPDNGTPNFTQTVAAYTPLTVPPAPTKTGYLFAGWYADSSPLKYVFFLLIKALSS